MSQLKKENRPEILLEEVDFKKNIETTVVAPKKYNLLHNLKKDISFVSVVSIALFAVLGNISIYVWNKNPPTVNYIPKQINLSETDLITNTAYKSAKTLLNFNANNINNPALNDYFYKNNLEQWKNTLKQIGIFDKVINNKGEVTTDIQEVNLMSKTIVHGIVRNIVTIPFSQTYLDKNEKTVTQGNLVLTIIENPDQENQFLISNTHIFMGESVSTTVSK